MKWKIDLSKLSSSGKGYCIQTFSNFKGIRFDPDLPAALRLEFAKSNTKNKGSGIKTVLHPNIAGLTAVDVNQVNYTILSSWYSFDYLYFSVIKIMNLLKLWF